MRSSKSDSVSSFAELSGYRFADPDLLRQALTHSSVSSAGKSNYERLEFLGDRVLGLVICEEIFNRFPGLDQGHLARRLNFLVRRQTCTEVARALHLETIARVGEGVSPGKGNSGKKVLADIIESVIGAIYLDGGLEPARTFILKVWEPFLEESESVSRDAKTALQEWALSLGLPLPHYSVVGRSGPDHQPEFELAVDIKGHDRITAKAASKRMAEQKAAAAFLDKKGLTPK